MLSVEFTGVARVPCFSLQEAVEINLFVPADTKSKDIKAETSCNTGIHGWCSKPVTSSCQNSVGLGIRKT